MSNTKLTPGHLISHASELYLKLIDGHESYLGLISGVYGWTGENEEWAKRIVACVNACEGIDNPESFIENAKDLYNMLDKVTQQRNLLLEAIVAIAELHPVQEGGREGCYAKATKLAQEARFKAVEDPRFQYNKVIFPQ